jgi:uncharacterized protein YhbP (UPF0306 family)
VSEPRAAVRARALALLQEHHVMTLATYDGGRPWAAAVFYASQGLDLFFLSKPSTRHARDLARNPRCAVTIQRDYSDWPQIKGIQAEGTSIELQGAEGERAIALYAQRFPLVGRGGGAPMAIARALSQVAWYRFRPERLYVIDNALGFGHRDALDGEDLI